MEKKLNAEIAELRAQFHQAPTLSLHAKIKNLLGELSAHLSDGAQPCDCGGKVHGMLRREIPVDSLKVRIYEVGCLSCPKASQGQSPQEAVANWNAGKYIPAKKGPTLTVIKNG